MLRTVGDQPTLWEAILPEELRRLPEEFTPEVHDEVARGLNVDGSLDHPDELLAQRDELRRDVGVFVRQRLGVDAGQVEAVEDVLAEAGAAALLDGQDADLASLKLIVEGKQTMTVYKSIQPLANGAVDAAIKLARGEKLNTTETIDNGFKKVPAILLEPIAVDRNNLVSTVVKDGYHKLEDICAGIPADKCPKP